MRRGIFRHWSSSDRGLFQVLLQLKNLVFRKQHSIIKGFLRAGGAMNADGFMPDMQRKASRLFRFRPSLDSGLREGKKIGRMSYGPASLAIDEVLTMTMTRRPASCFSYGLHEPHTSRTECRFEGGFYRVA
jgi:hypothetical protein